MIRICTQIKYDDDDDDVRGTGSPQKVNQFFRLMGPVITTMIDYCHTVDRVLESLDKER